MILHGTDTLAYTSSALSYMLENLGKPVIVTGSQIPAFETRSDGRDNLVGALIIAGNFSIPEVTVYFNHKLMRGNRTVKVSPPATPLLVSVYCSVFTLRSVLDLFTPSRVPTAALWCLLVSRYTWTTSQSGGRAPSQPSLFSPSCAEMSSC